MTEQQFKNLKTGDRIRFDETGEVHSVIVDDGNVVYYKGSLIAMAKDYWAWTLVSKGQTEPDEKFG